MAKDNRVNMPMSGAGITRYFEESKTLFRLKPLSIIILIIIVILVVLSLHMYGNSLLGIQ